MTIEQLATVLLIAQAILSSPGIAAAIVAYQKRRKTKLEEKLDEAAASKIEIDGAQAISTSSIELVKQYREEFKALRKRISDLEDSKIKLEQRVDILTRQVIALGGHPEAVA